MADTKMMPLEINRDKVESSANTIDTFVKLLEKEIKDIDETLIPLMRVYLNNVREIRMAMASEVKDILRSSVEMSKVAEHNKGLEDFIKTIMVLKNILTPETIELLRRVIKE